MKVKGVGRLKTGAIIRRAVVLRDVPPASVSTPAQVVTDCRHPPIFVIGRRAGGSWIAPPHRPAALDRPREFLARPPETREARRAYDGARTGHHRTPVAERARPGPASPGDGGAFSVPGLVSQAPRPRRLVHHIFQAPASRADPPPAALHEKAPAARFQATVLLSDDSAGDANRTAWVALQAGGDGGVIPSCTTDGVLRAWVGRRVPAVPRRPEVVPQASPVGPTRCCSSARQAWRSPRSIACAASCRQASAEFCLHGRYEK